MEYKTNYTTTEEGGVNCRYCSDQGTIKGCEHCGKIRELIPIIKNVDNNITLPIYNVKELPEYVIRKGNSHFDKFELLVNSLMDNSTKGLLPKRIIVLQIPDSFDRNKLLGVIRNNYEASGTKVSPIRTLEELSSIYSQVKKERCSFDKLLEGNIMLLSCIEDNIQLETYLKQAIKLLDIYQKAGVICIPQIANVELGNVTSVIVN